jgi:hypothetical protein
MLSYVVEFTTDIRHMLGVNKVVANTLSGLPPVASLHTTWDRIATSLHFKPDRIAASLHSMCGT